MSRKQTLTRKRAIVKDSLKGFTEDYTDLGFTKEQATALAQLTYGQKQIRKRLDSLEAIALAQVLGVVEISGVMHRLSCAKRDERTNECDCGHAAAKEG